MNMHLFLKLMCGSLISVLFLISCNRGGNGTKDPPHGFAQTDSITTAMRQVDPPLSDLEKKLLESGLVDVHDLDSSIKVNMKYAGTDNFFRQNVYGAFCHAYLQPDVAAKLVCAQKYLKELHPAYSLVVFDAARPMSLQRMIWDSLKMPGSEKIKYAANPRNGGSLHNYGAAVDVSILDSSGKELDMGCPFDYFGELAFPVSESKLLARGELNEHNVANRKLLRKVMLRAGFFNIQTEWWHFNSCSREKAMDLYTLIE
jgi:zinc D-Ala-D-Ala dipeptidase